MEFSHCFFDVFFHGFPMLSIPGKIDVNLDMDRLDIVEYLSDQTAQIKSNDAIQRTKRLFKIPKSYFKLIL